VLRTSLAGLLKETRQYSEAIPLYEQTIRDKIQLVGANHPVVAISMGNLAELHLRSKQTSMFNCFCLSLCVPLDNFVDFAPLSWNQPCRCHFLCVCVCVCVCKCVLCVFMCVCMHVRACVYIYTYICIYMLLNNVLTYVYVCVCMCVCVCVCHPISEKALPLFKNALRIMLDAKGPIHPQVAILYSSVASCYVGMNRLVSVQYITLLSIYSLSTRLMCYPPFVCVCVCDVVCVCVMCGV